MKLFSLTGTSSVSNEELGEFLASEEDGSFDLPHDFALTLLARHQDGLPAWETEGEKQLRLARAEAERRRDPATLLDAVEKLVAAQEPPAPKKATPKPPKA